LDLGCGPGKPIGEFLVKKGFKVFGIDFSERQIKLARKNVSGAKYEVRDISELKEGDFSVEAVVSFYAIFHLPKEIHQDLFRIINSFLPKQGIILVTMGSEKWEGTGKDFHGVGMYWSHYGAEKNRKIIEKTGFKILFDEIDKNGGEKHQIILAKKI